MPAISQDRVSNTILVTGANGYVGTWLVRTALERGYAVRAAVRSEKSGAHLLESFRAYVGKLSLCFVGDIAADGAFDEAVKNVQGIIHAASPVILAPVDVQDVILPAVRGAVGILKSAMIHGHSVQRIVMTSSCAAVVDSTGEKQTVSESDWNEAAVAAVDDPKASKYAASKVLAERAAWEFYNANKAQLSWELTILNPPMIFGPGIHPHASPADLRPVCNWWYDVVMKGSFGSANPLTQPGHAWIDVRDVAEAHVRALETEKAGDERIIVSAGLFVWQDWLDAAHVLPQTQRQGYEIPRGKNGQKMYAITFDPDKERQILGLKFKSMEQVTADLLADFHRRGW